MNLSTCCILVLGIENCIRRYPSRNFQTKIKYCVHEDKYMRWNEAKWKKYFLWAFIHVWTMWATHWSTNAREIFESSPQIVWPDQWNRDKLFGSILPVYVQTRSIMDKPTGQQITNKTHPYHEWCRKQSLMLCVYSLFLLEQTVGTKVNCYFCFRLC